MSKDNVKTTLDKYELQTLAYKYKDESYGFFIRGKVFTQIIFTIFFTALAYGIGWCLFKFGKWMEWWNNIWYLPVIFSAITFAICLFISIKSTIAKNKILKQIPKEDKPYFFSLVGIEYKKEDKHQEDVANRRHDRKISSIQATKTYSEYDIERANQKEKQAMKREQEEALSELKNINSNLEQIKNNQDKIEVYDVYNKKGNRVGKIEKK